MRKKMTIPGTDNRGNPTTITLDPDFPDQITITRIGDDGKEETVIAQREPRQPGSLKRFINRFFNK